MAIEPITKQGGGSTMAGRSCLENKISGFFFIPNPISNFNNFLSCSYLLLFQSSLLEAKVPQKLKL